MCFIDDRVDLDQHFGLEVLVGGEVGGTATSAHNLDVFVEFSQAATEGRVKFVLH